MSLEIVTSWSGHRFSVRYGLQGSESEAHAKARMVCFDQTVELPESLVPRGPLRDHVIGRIEAFQRRADDLYEATISYAVEFLTSECGQLLNVVFGISSLNAGVRVLRLDLPDDVLRRWRGPRFGQAGLRERLQIPKRPVVCGVLKPFGLSVAALADLAYQLALGGLDMVKDDQAMSDQTVCPFEERVAACAEAVASAVSKTGRPCLYAAHVTGDREALCLRSLFAKRVGAGAVLICPGLAGFDAVRTLAEDDTIDLPILSHPNLLGSYVLHRDSGMAPAVLFGQMPRLAGADITIYPYFGGPFSMTREDCRLIARAASEPWGHLKPIFPTAASRIGLDRIPELCALYGNEVVLIVGSGIYQQGVDRVKACERVMTLVARAAE